MFLIENINKDKCKVFVSLILLSSNKEKILCLLNNGLIPTAQLIDGKTTEEIASELFNKLTNASNYKWKNFRLNSIHDNILNTVEDERAIYLLYFDYCPNFYPPSDYQWVSIEDLVQAYPEVANIILNNRREIDVY